MLITAQQLEQKFLAGDEVLLLDCRSALPGSAAEADYGFKQYLAAHLPGAIYVDLEKDLSAKPVAGSGRHPLPDAAEFLDLVQAWGLHPSKLAVVYDDAGALIASRLWWMLRYWLGHPQVVVLDGGFNAWRDAGLATESGQFFGSPTSFRFDCDSRYIKSTDDVRQIVAGRHSECLVDARATNRFSGETETIDPVAGHIPGAVNLPCMDNLSGDGRFLSSDKLKARFESLLKSRGGVEAIVHSCGSGVTACHNILAMEIAGYPGSCLYAGSWSEWITDPENPVATGP